MNDPVHLVSIDRVQQVRHLHYVAPVELEAVHVRLQVGPGRRQVETDYIFTAFDQLANNAVADKAGGAGYHD